MKNMEKKSLTRNEWIILVFGMSLLFGIFVRFFPGLWVGFPLNDGGMFLSMVRDLKVSHYVLPSVTTYNDLNIPFAYPPFGFYFARLLSDVFHISEMHLLRWIPPTVNTLSIGVFYFLASALLESRRRGAVAALFYALTPGASAWFIMGGGLTRSFGSLFMLLSVWWAYHLFRNGSRLELSLTVLFCSLTVLSHPEVGIHTAATCILLYIFYGRTKRSTLNVIIVGLATLAISALWWGNVILYHGLAPFLSALNTGSYKTFFLGAFILSLIASQSYLPVLMVARIVGFGWGIWKRKYFLLAWSFIPFLVEPRSSPSIAFYPFCMLMALAFTDALPALVDYIKSRWLTKTKAQGGEGRTEAVTPDFNERKWLTAVLLLLAAYLFVESSLFDFKLINTSLAKADREAMAWIQENTPKDSHFLPLTGIDSPEIDPFVEWFPALTERRSQTTIQGFEWTLGPDFYVRYVELADVQKCKSAECIAEWSARTGIDYQYIVLQISGVDKKLPASLESAGGYELVYSTKEVAVYLLK